MGEYSDWKPQDDLGHSSEGTSAEQVIGYPGYGPSVPPGYPHGSFNEPDMGWEGGWEGWRRRRLEWRMRHRGLFGWLRSLFIP